MRTASSVAAAASMGGRETWTVTELHAVQLAARPISGFRVYMHEVSQHIFTASCGLTPVLHVCRQRAISKGTELKDAGAMLELLPMVSADKEYRPSAFWAQLLELDADTVVNANAEDGSNASGLQLQRGQLSVST